MEVSWISTKHFIALNFIYVSSASFYLDSRFFTQYESIIKSILFWKLEIFL